jgi:endonuclease/exonuclease/phosphatase family metal-dependent hydrolase
MVDYQRLQKLLQDENPDIAAFQECEPDLEDYFPTDWNSIRAGEIVVASRWPLRRKTVVRQPIGWGYTEAICNAVEVQLPSGVAVFAAVHFSSPRDGLTRILDAKWVIAPSRRGTLESVTRRRHQQQRRVIAALGESRDPMIVAGDFNTPIESRIYQSVWGTMRNAFSEGGWGLGGTIQVAVRGFEYWARIDHVLFDKPWRCRWCRTGMPIGSDHLPLICEIAG